MDAEQPQRDEQQLEGRDDGTGRRTSDGPATPSRKTIRWWPLWGIVAVIGLLGTGLLVAPDLTPQTRNAGVQVLGLLAVGLTLVWWIVLSRAPWRWRGIVALAAAAVAVFLATAIRSVGVTGDLWLDIAWRWSPAPAESIETIGGDQGAAPVVDLTVTGPDDFPQFLGPQRDGTVHGVRLARDWEQQPPELLWRRAVGSGWSSFAVVNGFAITQEQHADQQTVACYEVKSGRVCWQYSYPSEFHSVLGGDGPRATPTIDAGQVFVLGPNGALICLEGSDGSLVWRRNVLDDHGAENVEYGMSGSPLVYDDLVIVSAGGPSGHSLVAYDRHTGEPRWHGGDDPAGYSSPAVATVAGVEQVLILNHTSVAGHDPRSGRVLWRYDWPGENAKVPQPCPWQDDKVFVSSGFGAGCELLQLVANESGGLEVRSLWRNRLMKPKFTNVVIRDGYVYGLDNGILACLELATGRRQWKKGRYRHGQVLLVNDLLLVQSEFGDVVLVEATPEAHRELCRIAALEGRSWNNPALYGSYLLVRNDHEAACYRLPLE